MLFKVDENNTFGGNILDEAGEYNVEIIKSDLGQSSQGNPMVRLDYRVLDGTHQGDEIKFADQLVWVDVDPESLEKSVRRFNDLLVKIGVPNGTVIDTIDDYARGLMGKQLAITVEWQEQEFGRNKGNYYLHVKYHDKLQQGGSKPNGQHRPQAKANNNAGGFKTGGAPQGQNGFQGQSSPQQQQQQMIGDGSQAISNNDLPF
ncbi:DUF669 domain-containing protein [Limosilactobacillus fermentum]|uniref:DUF669 domain-containing protein n=1 Tax=Limosilactobacillus fermentum TaxID=1613 RepID=UPI0021A91C98|nr:DUF669 domain-containing protein [Limosilactobacillus fermentum]MCT3436738.1 DUF669 domain-containing protein [Limosilactobacillus fermentum]